VAISSPPLFKNLLPASLGAVRWSFGGFFVYNGLYGFCVWPLKPGGPVFCIPDGKIALVFKLWRAYILRSFHDVKSPLELVQNQPVATIEKPPHLEHETAWIPALPLAKKQRPPAPLRPLPNRPPLLRPPPSRPLFLPKRQKLPTTPPKTFRCSRVWRRCEGGRPCISATRGAGPAPLRV